LSQQIDAADLETLDTLLPPNAGERKTLADLIFSKLDDAPEEDENTPPPQKAQKGVYHLPCCFPITLTVLSVRIADPERAPDPAEGLNPKVVEVYTK
jgi:essential nuclear protein 1